VLRLGGAKSEGNPSGCRGCVGFEEQFLSIQIAIEVEANCCH
jgi:hypothetical protein